jgi:hypothetical protein
MPCSVNAKGSDPPRYFFEGIAFCDTKISTQINIAGNYVVRHSKAGIFFSHLFEIYIPQ